MAERKVLAANTFPKIANPTRNNAHVKSAMILSIVKKSDGMMASITMASPDIPPATRSKGNRKTAVPKAKIKVPAINKMTLRVCFHTSFFMTLTPPQKIIFATQKPVGKKMMRQKCIIQQEKLHKTLDNRYKM